MAAHDARWHWHWQLPGAVLCVECRDSEKRKSIVLGEILIVCVCVCALQAQQASLLLPLLQLLLIPFTASVHCVLQLCLQVLQVPHQLLHLLTGAH